MENQLIQIYLFVCQTYDTHFKTCFQRMSNNSNPKFTDQELLTIWFFAHLNGCFQKKQMYEFIKHYWIAWFPLLPSYQTFVFRLNQLEPTFQSFGAALSDILNQTHAPELDHIIDSMPVMLAHHGHSYGARVALEVANAGYCSAKKTRFHGVRLHFIAQRRSGRLPSPSQIWMCEASHHDSKAFIEQGVELPETRLFGDLAYPTPEIMAHLNDQQTQLIAPRKQPKGGELSESEIYYNRLVRKCRQPIESLFNWINEKTGIQKASKVRSSDALMTHCWGKLAVAFFLLVFYY
jgi:hypothetical protein